jgi:hypothetical protein
MVDLGKCGGDRSLEERLAGIGGDGCSSVVRLECVIVANRTELGTFFVSVDGVWVRTIIQSKMARIETDVFRVGIQVLPFVKRGYHVNVDKTDVVSEGKARRERSSGVKITYADLQLLRLELPERV